MRTPARVQTLSRPAPGHLPATVSAIPFRGAQITLRATELWPVPLLISASRSGCGRELRRCLDKQTCARRNHGADNARAPVPVVPIDDLAFKSSFLVNGATRRAYCRFLVCKELILPVRAVAARILSRRLDVIADPSERSNVRRRSSDDARSGLQAPYRFRRMDQRHEERVAAPGAVAGPEVR